MAVEMTRIRPIRHGSDPPFYLIKKNFPFFWTMGIYKNVSRAYACINTIDVMTYMTMTSAYVYSLQVHPRSHGSL